IAAEGKSGLELIRSLATVVGVKTKDTRPTNLRRQIVRFLAEIGPHDSSRDEVAEGLERVARRAGHDLASEGERVLRILRPPAPEPDHPPRAPRKVSSKKSPQSTAPTPDAPLDYAAVQATAEKMGVELQARIMKLMAGPGTPEEKMRESTRLSEEFQAAIKKLYGA